MTLKAMYHDVTSHAMPADQFGSIRQSHEEAIAQIQGAHLGLKPPYRVLDFGVGNGVFLKTLKEQLPFATFTGIDVSVDKLKHAEEALPLTTIEASATEASQYLPHHSQDLVLAHFINAYVPLQTLFHEAHRLTRANGHFSIITTTYDAFPIAQQQLAAFIAGDSLLSRIVGHYYKTMVKNTTVAASAPELLQAFETHQFQVIKHQRLHVPIHFETIDDMTMFGLEGTWFFNQLSIRMLPKDFVMQRLNRLFSKIFKVPYDDTHIIDVVLARK